MTDLLLIALCVAAFVYLLWLGVILFEARRTRGRQ